jgi:hypothetical protein
LPWFLGFILKILNDAGGNISIDILMSSQKIELSEYDFTQLTVVARGQGRKKSNLTVELDPDVATVFPDSGAVRAAAIDETNSTESSSAK